MKHFLNILIPATLLLSQNLLAQQDKFAFYSRNKFLFKDEVVIKSLDEIENAVMTSKNLGLCDVFFYGLYFNQCWVLPMTMEDILNINAEHVKTSNYECDIKWNHQLDTGHVIGFSRIYHNEPYVHGHFKNKDISLGKKETPLFTIPLGEYKLFLNKDQHDFLRKTINQNLISMFQIRELKSILISENQIKIDSLNILPQAPLSQFKDFLISLLLSGEIDGYRSPILEYPLGKQECEELFTKTDSASYNNGQKIGKVAIRSDELPEYISVVETWKIFDSIFPNEHSFYISPMFKITKKISAIGLKNNNDKEVFFDFNLLKKASESKGVNFEAFNQIFIGQASKHLNIIYAK